jgi:hypothetical protein
LSRALEESELTKNSRNDIVAGINIRLKLLKHVIKMDHTRVAKKNLEFKQKAEEN